MKRFYVAQSLIYGLAVYDRTTQTPAYTAAEKLRKAQPDGSYVAPDVTQLSAYQALSLCATMDKLNFDHAFD